MLDLNDEPKTEEVTYKGKTIKITSDVPVKHFIAIVSINDKGSDVAENMKTTLKNYLAECNTRKEAEEFVDILTMRGLISVVKKIAELIREDTAEIKKKMQPIEPSEG